MNFNTNIPDLSDLKKNYSCQNLSKKVFAKNKIQR